MPTLSITKSYSNGSVLTETDLDNIRTDITTFFNTTKIDSDNIQANGVQGSKLNSNVADGTTLEYASSAIRIKDGGVSRAKLAALEKIPAGCVQLFHTFNGAVSIPRGWMPLDGDTVSEANYEATHGAGTYATDGVASSPLLGKNLPNMSAKFPIGATSTTQDGSVAITYTGNASNQINIEHTHTGPSHNHQWLTFGTGATDDATFDSGGSSQALTAAGRTNGVAIKTQADGAASDIGGGNSAGTFYTNNAGTGNTGTGGSATQSITPHSCEFIYIMKVI